MDGTTTKDYFPLYDGTGHLTGLSDSAGNLVAEYWYGPFGELLEAKGEMADANPFRYATKYFDTETGLYYFGHRYYDPTSGQWMSREILGEDESLNLYIPNRNDPVNFVDRLGLAAVAIDGAVSSTLETVNRIITGEPEPSLDEEIATTMVLAESGPQDLIELAFVDSLVQATAMPDPEIDWSHDHSLKLWAKDERTPLSDVNALADSLTNDATTKAYLREVSQGRSDGAADWRLFSSTAEGASYMTPVGWETAATKGLAASIIAIRGVKAARGFSRALHHGDEAIEMAMEAKFAVNREFRIGEEIAGLKIQRVLPGNNGKIALIGRSMGNSNMVGVRDAHRELVRRGYNVEIFDASALSGDTLRRFQAASKQFEQSTQGWNIRLSNSELMKLDMYKLNKEWARMLKADGYQVLDFGDINNNGFSPFYSMEKLILFK
jgi:RHS repeat-associated protein